MPPSGTSGWWLFACCCWSHRPPWPNRGGDCELTWSTVDGGGETVSIGGVYMANGTAGQPEAGLLTGGDFAVAGGFLPGGAVAMYRIYLPPVLRNQ